MTPTSGCSTWRDSRGSILHDGRDVIHPGAARHLRLVFSSEPVDRLGALGERVGAALA